eukprot:TRINITY_DN119_c2_g1_i1.p1 TRINITY_DN119_c2_g1~~TRINITY_DN119_c2_g1_i1.p1  ORF type:complete len:650 (+),score=257.87 TRINITY_DN119_c2_g1_i1:58-2007(+)
MPGKRDAKTIQVYLRLRPPNQGEKDRGERCDVVKIDPENPRLVRLGDNPNPFNFHHCFGNNSRQEDVFNKFAAKAVDDTFSGYHGLMFVYGQTGTGKTWTISNKMEGQEGMLQRCCKAVFQRIGDDKQGDYEVQATYIQVYQEVIQDLLINPKDAPKDNKKGLQIRDDPDVEGGVYLNPCTFLPIYSSSDTPDEGEKSALHAFHQGDKNKAVGCTDMNAVSSRSHSVFTLYITRRNKMTEQDYESQGASNKQEFKGRLILVDLAGCERQKKTGAEGNRLKEANAINSSLLVLGNCIKALTDPKQFVPFRESKLTRLLQYGLAGMGKTSIVITCGPSERNLDETRGAIEFGQRAMTIKEQAKAHVEIDYKALCKQLQAQLDARGDTLNQGLIEEVKAEYEELLEQRDDKIKMLEAELELARAGGDGGGSRPGGYSGNDGGKESSPTGGSSGEKKGSSSSGGDGGGGGGKDAAKLEAKVGKYKEMMESLKERLDDKGKDVAKYRKERNKAAKDRDEFESKLSQKTYELNILAMRNMNTIRERDEQLERLHAALLKVKAGDYVSPTATIDLEDTEAQSPRPEGMKDDEFISKLQAAIRAMKEREAMLAAYQQNAKDAIKLQSMKLAEEASQRVESEKRALKYKQKYLDTKEK